jgi:hypothetical protein
MREDFYSSLPGEGISPLSDPPIHSAWQISSIVDYLTTLTFLHKFISCDLNNKRADVAIGRCSEFLSAKC